MTGTVMPTGELAAIAGWCADHDVQLVSDEIYHGIPYGQDAPGNRRGWARPADTPTRRQPDMATSLMGQASRDPTRRGPILATGVVGQDG